MDIIGIGHLLAAVLALGSGFLVAIARKGTTFHRRVGWVYFVSMVAVNASAFMIYDLFGRFGPFHFAAMVSGVTVVLGILPAFRRRPRRQWIAHHAYWMAWSYVGLCAAAASEISTRYLDIPFGTTVGLATFAVVGMGAFLINRRVPKILSSDYGIQV